MTAFRQVVGKLQEGQRQEALIGLEFVLRLDDRFAPATNLQKQLASGSQAIDLAAVIAELQAPSTGQIDELLIEAVDDFNQRSYAAAKEKVEKVLLDLPGHAEARRFRDQVEEAIKQAEQVGQYLGQAREALAGGEAQEAANFVMMAQALDPHHPGIASALQEIQSGAPAPAAAPPAPPSPPDEVSFEPPAAPPVATEAPPEEEEAKASPVDWDAVSLEPAEAAPEAPAAVVPEEPEGELDDSLFSLDTDEPEEEEPAAAPAGDDFAFVADEAAPAEEFGVPSEVAETADDFAFTADEEAPAEEFGVPSEVAETADDFAFTTEEAAPAEEFGIPSDVADDGDDFAFTVDDAAPEVAEAPLFGGQGDDVSDLFVAEVDSPLAAEGGEDSAEIEQLLEQGGVAFDQGEFQQAIDVWSRIFLIDPSHAEATSRIEVARTRLGELDSRLDEVLERAREALASGDAERAQTLVDEILTLRPDHMGALELKEQIAPGAEGAAPTLPDLDEDLFGEEDLFAEEAALDDSTAGLVQALDKKAPVAAPAKKTSPLLMGLIGVGAVAVILAGFFFGRGLISGDSADSQAEALNRILAQAEEYHSQGKTEEAIHLLESFTPSELDRPRLERRLATYRQAVAPPTPTAIPQSLTAAEELVESGQWMAAYAEVQRGLAASPQDAGLIAVKERILRHEPLIASLHKAVESSDYRSAVGLAQDLVRRHPGSREFAHELERHLYNASVAELQSFNLTGAEAHLERLLRLAPEDAEAQRIRRFIAKYKTKPVDMQLKIFIRSLPYR